MVKNQFILIRFHNGKAIKIPVSDILTFTPSRNGTSMTIHHPRGYTFLNCADPDQLSTMMKETFIQNGRSILIILDSSSYIVRSYILNDNFIEKLNQWNTLEER